jgi:hypothetical protein
MFKKKDIWCTIKEAHRSPIQGPAPYNDRSYSRLGTMNDTVPSDHDDDHDGSSSEASAYEPEYEWEEIQIPGVALVQKDDDDGEHHDSQRDYDAKDNAFSLHVLTVVPPPLEYMSRLHSQQREISGRQVWTGSLFLAHVLFHDATEQKLLLTCPRQRYVLFGPIPQCLPVVLSFLIL